MTAIAQNMSAIKNVSASRSVPRLLSAYVLYSANLPSTISLTFPTVYVRHTAITGIPRNAKIRLKTR